MSDKVFLDTNILVYANLEDSKHIAKRKEAISLIDSLDGSEVIISVQVLNELYSVMIKHDIQDDIIQKRLRIISESVIVSDISMDVVKRCWNIRKRYHYSYYDSLIIASAIESGCSILYTEDLQSGQKIGSSLIIRNPFA